MDEKGATFLCDLLAQTGESAESAAAGSSTSLYLIVLRGGVPGQMILLRRGKQSLGRAPENALQIADMSISRSHATLLVDEDGLVWLTDIGSTNGTYLNGQRLGAQQTVGLRDGDRVGFGPSVLMKFVRTDSLDENHHREMFERSVRDPLTGLFNRAHFVSQLNALLHQTYRRDLGCAVLMLDLDHFKRINDTFGHTAGDEVLRQVANALRQSTRSGDLVARYGGEEFIVALPIVSIELAWDRAERIRQQFKARTIAVGGAPLQVTVSIGVAFGASNRPLSVERLIAGSDRALYQAKDSGRDRVYLDVAEYANDNSDVEDEALAFPPSSAEIPVIPGGLTTVDFEVFRE